MKVDINKLVFKLFVMYHRTINKGIKNGSLWERFFKDIRFF